MNKKYYVHKCKRCLIDTGIPGVMTLQSSDSGFEPLHFYQGGPIINNNSAGVDGIYACENSHTLTVKGEG